MFTLAVEWWAGVDRGPAESGHANLPWTTLYATGPLPAPLEDDCSDVTLGRADCSRTMDDCVR